MIHLNIFVANAKKKIFFAYYSEKHDKQNYFFKLNDKTFPFWKDLTYFISQYQQTKVIEKI